ncbi:hypothetical protein [Deinococcus altitudinis]|uniref:hypothetical protein n=1 Tax=Deinococcus altitudinis TaxID=468914 RepID=UPI003891FDB6
MNTPPADDAHQVPLLIRPFDANSIQVPAHIVQFFFDLNYSAKKKKKTVGLLFGQIQIAASGPHFTVCYAMALETLQYHHDPWPRFQLCDILTAQDVAWDLRGYTAFGYWMFVAGPSPSPGHIVERLSVWIPPGADIAEHFIITVSCPQPHQLDFQAYSYASRDPLIDLRQVQLDLGVPIAPSTSTIALPDKPSPS